MLASCARLTKRGTARGLYKILYKGSSHGLSHWRPPANQSSRPTTCTTTRRSGFAAGLHSKSNRGNSFSRFDWGTKAQGLVKSKHQPSHWKVWPKLIFSQLNGTPRAHMNSRPQHATSGATSAGSRQTPSSTYKKAAWEM